MIITKHRAIYAKPGDLKVIKSFKFKAPASKGKDCIDIDDVQQIIEQVQMLLADPTYPESSVVQKLQKLNPDQLRQAKEELSWFAE